MTHNETSSPQQLRSLTRFSTQHQRGGFDLDESRDIRKINRLAVA